MQDRTATYRLFRDIAGLLLGVLMFCMPTSAAGQVRIVTPSSGMVSALNRQLVTVRGTPGTLVELCVNGSPVRRDTVRIDGLLDFLNVEVPAGDVGLAVGLAGTDGGVVLFDSCRIHILGAPATVVLNPEKKELYADGVSSTTIAVRLYDRWNVPVVDGYTVTVEADSGSIVAEDIDPSQRGVQLRLTDSVARFTYVAGHFSGTARLTVRVGELASTAEIALNTPYESFTMVGLAGGTAQAASAGGDRTGVMSSASYPDGLATDGRIAVYASGTVLTDYRLTLSYDTDRRNTDRFYRDIDPDYLYSIYGDNSMLSYDAQTTRQLYARLEHNKDFILLGDYNTDLTKEEFTQYNRSLYGLKGGYEENGWKLQGFGALTDRHVVQLELRGTGLSGLYDLGYLNVTPGSEKIRLETRDRFHSELLLKQTDQYRFSDYDIDYAQGTIYFKQPVPAIDGQGNPVYIVVSFEAYDGSKQSYLAGGRAEKSFGEHVTVGVNGVIEQQDPSPYALLGADVNITPVKQISLSGEVGHSDRSEGSGIAYKVEAAFTPFDVLSMKGYYRQVDTGFYNITQAGSGRELGTKKQGVSGNYQMFPGTRVSVDYYRSFQETGQNSVTVNSVSGGIDEKFTNDLNGSVRLEDRRYDGPSQDSAAEMTKHSLLATGRLGYQVNSRLTLSVQRDQNLGADEDVTRPDATSLAGEYRVFDPVSLQAQEKFLAGGGSLSTFGVNTTPLEGTSVYGKYEIGSVIGQYRNMISVGLKNRLRLPWDLTANLGFERTRSLEHQLGEASTDDHTSVSGSLEYLPSSPVKGSVKAEYGEDAQRKKSNYQLGIDYRLWSDLSLIGKYLLSWDEALNNSGSELRDHLILGAAYRPVASNVFNLIGKFEEKRDNNEYVAPFDDARASIVSVHAFLEPLNRIEFSAKYAFKYGVDRTVGFQFVSHSYFYLLDMHYNLTDRFDVGGEYRLLRQTEANDWLFGYNAEVGAVTVKNLRVAAGYNFKGYKEPDLVDYAVWTKGPYIRMNMKFDEGLFGL
ncbi:MAG TPA: hypothetical protein VMW43_05000 [Bacteroidota bacterium]|nr:hypothetical protein [Bacteroidota bacterium]